jgi:hypothetical protein
VHKDRLDLAHLIKDFLAMLNPGWLGRTRHRESESTAAYPGEILALMLL